MNSPSFLIQQLQQGDLKALARAITIVENDLAGSFELLEHLSIKNIPLIGITGPPGAGKSSLINSLFRELLKSNYKIGLVAVDPSSPFNFGSLLGDRIRLSQHFNNPSVFIRSIATRGSLGGLSEKTIEITDVMKTFPFDFIFIETVGVGQSEVEISGLADTTVVVMVPEAGDEVQTMKAGLMEIADIFVVNKADHVDADKLVKNLNSLVASKASITTGEKPVWRVPVIKTIAIRDEGTDELLQVIQHHQDEGVNTKRPFLLAEKCWRIIQKERMKDISRIDLMKEVQKEVAEKDFNVYRFAKRYLVN